MLLLFLRKIHNVMLEKQHRTQANTRKKRDRQTDRQKERQTDKETDKETEIERQRPDHNCCIEKSCITKISLISYIRV